MPTAPTAPQRHEPRELEAAVARVKAAAPAWARASPADRIEVARALLAGTARTAERAVRLACQAKGLSPDSPAGGEEWMSGPYVTARLLRQLIESLEGLQRRGETPIGPLGETVDGRLTAGVFPMDLKDRALFMGIRADVHLEAGVTPEVLRQTRGRFHRQPDHDGRVCLVLGAGNINSIPATDVLTRLFVEGKTCVLKMNPVNAYLGPVLEEAFQAAVARGLLAIVHGGGEEGAWLCRHPAVDEIHITGSDATHDLIVWGPPGPERAERMARGRPLLDKPISSELGNITPVLVVPGPWDERRLAFQAEGLAGMVTHNASFNCIAGKLLVTARGWRQRRRFLELLQRRLAVAPPRQAWYPGAAERHQRLTAGRTEVWRAPELAPEGTLPWTLLTGLDAAAEDRAFRVEPFCSILSETSLGSEDPLEFLAAAVDFANRRLWGTLAATLVVHPRTMADPATRGAVERAIAALHYGTVTVNVWAGYAFAFGTTPWGAWPGSPLTDIQSGRGWVHNSLMLERVEKCVLRHPAVTWPKPPFFPSHRTAHLLSRRLLDVETGGGWAAVPGVVAAAARG